MSPTKSKRKSKKHDKDENSIKLHEIYENLNKESNHQDEVNGSIVANHLSEGDDDMGIIDDTVVHDIDIEDENLVSRLCKIDINIYWDRPKLHTISSQVIRNPNKATQEKILDLGLPWKRGRFNDEEDRIISVNWKKLCKKYDLPDAPDVFARWRNKENDSHLNNVRYSIIMWLARNLPNRTPAQVYHRFIHTLGVKSKGRFSSAQLSIVEEYFCSSDKTQTQQYLGATLGRDERSIWRCIKLLEKKYSTNNYKIKWNLLLCEQVVNALISVIQKQSNEKVDLNTLRYHKITWSNWKEVSNIVDLPPLNIKVHWNIKLYPMLFARKPIFFRQVILKLLNIFIEEKYKYWGDVDWQKTATHFKYLTSLFLYKKFYYFAHTYCKEYFKDFNKIVENLHNELFIIRTIPFPNKRLMRFGMNEYNQLYVINDD